MPKRASPRSYTPAAPLGRPSCPTAGRRTPRLAAALTLIAAVAVGLTMFGRTTVPVEPPDSVAEDAASARGTFAAIAATAGARAEAPHPTTTGPVPETPTLAPWTAQTATASAATLAAADAPPALPTLQTP